ncbi:hypothetical protein [Hydrogenophaga sp.]|nr:hypothetical protein [Hydrogenophaga sp.]
MDKELILDVIEQHEDDRTTVTVYLWLGAISLLFLSVVPYLAFA